MSFWPFNRKRRNSAKDGEQQAEKARPAKTSGRPPADSHSHSTPPPPRKSSRRPSQRKRGASFRRERSGDVQRAGSKGGAAAGKENVSPGRGSREDITALPMSQRLRTSPHLRPIDADRVPPIPYNFRQHSTSESSVLQLEASASEKAQPGRSKSKRSGYEKSTPQRTRSSKKRRDDHLREEEIRAMSAALPIPKRPGEGPLRRDSKKLKGLGLKDSTVSLPPEGSIHSSMSGVVEQRGWEVGHLDIFNPRPAVRLSGAPQYVSPLSFLGPSPLSRNASKRETEPKKETAVEEISKDKAKKRQTIGDRADDLGAADLRLLLERDAKRREKRRRAEQERIDRKLRKRGSRERNNSAKKRRSAEAQLAKETIPDVPAIPPTAIQRAELHRQISGRIPTSPYPEGQRAELQRQISGRIPAGEQRAELQRQISGRLVTPPTDVHPALRNGASAAEIMEVGLGIQESEIEADSIDAEHQQAFVLPTTKEAGLVNTGTYLNYPAGGNIPENPFEDPAPLPTPEPEHEPEVEKLPVLPVAFTPLGSPMEDPMAELGQTIHASATSTPPLSPVQSHRAPSALSHVRTNELPPVPPIPFEERRASEPKERRAGAWASFFRRGATTRRAGDTTPSEISFSNTSRESMRNQPIPAHLIDTRQPPAQRKKSGTPVRTQSRFREDLPEMPISPPDSRTQSPDVTKVAAAIAAAHRSRQSPNPIDTANQLRKADAELMRAAAGPADTPVSPGGRAHDFPSGSLASVGSEGSWLASGSMKRRSTQSGLSRSMGSLSKRKPEFSASYEELGGDKDAEYFQRMTVGSKSDDRKLSSAAITASSPTDARSDVDDASSRPTTSGDPLTVHDSVRRQPTLVHRDPRIKSREGLLADFDSGSGGGGGGDAETPDESDDDHLDAGEPEAQVHRARSVNYGKAHVRHMSAGSAKLLDMPKRQSADFEKFVSASSPASPMMRRDY